MHSPGDGKKERSNTHLLLQTHGYSRANVSEAFDMPWTSARVSSDGKGESNII